MLNKDQALATLDLHIIRAEAERKRRLERRVRNFTVLYPPLRHVPLEEREALVVAANKHSLRRWPIYALGILAIAGGSAAILALDQTSSSRAAAALTAAVLIAMFIPAVAFYLHNRSYMKRVVANQIIPLND